MTAITKYLSEIGARGGSATSKAKSEAARRNGAKGGRPRTASKPNELRNYKSSLKK